MATKFYDLLVAYRYKGNDKTFNEEFKCVTESIIKGVRRRFEADYEKGDYKELVFIINKIQ